MSYFSFCGIFLYATWRIKTQGLARGCMEPVHPCSLLAISSHEVKRNPPITWPKGSGYPLLFLHGAIPALQPQGDEAGLIIVINVFLVSRYSVPEGILWVWYMSHCGMQQDFLALQLWRYSIHLRSAYKTCSPETWRICFAEAEVETPGKFL